MKKLKFKRFLRSLKCENGELPYLEYFEKSFFHSGGSSIDFEMYFWWLKIRYRDFLRWEKRLRPLIVDFEDYLSEVYNLQSKKLTTDYNVLPDTIVRILSDFITFVWEEKGHKIEIGDHLIEKFISEKISY